MNYLTIMTECLSSKIEFIPFQDIHDLTKGITIDTVSRRGIIKSFVQLIMGFTI